MSFLIDRRNFLKASTGAFVLAAGRRTLADAGEVRLAVLSDTHIAADPNDRFRGFSPHSNLKKTLDQVAASRFDMLVVNGDLARLNGQPEDYLQFAKYLDPLAAQMPLVVTLGNHDDRKNARAALVKRAGEVQPVEQKLVTTIDTGPFQLVMLDSLMATNIVAGQLGKSQRAWLAEYLDEQGSKPLIVFVHHNPDPEGDAALVDAERLLAILRPRKSVKALLFGHTHFYAYDKQDGLHLVNLPAVGYNFADGNPVGWVEAAFRPQGAALTLHAIAGETRDDGKVTMLDWR
ncbi:MAG: metallophosphoesterase [Acidobacteriaceae bacterium]|nr:metallophosphoesterase [Acidobacteriaceae bacterium]